MGGLRPVANIRQVWAVFTADSPANLGVTASITISLSLLAYLADAVPLDNYGGYYLVRAFS